MPPEAVDRIIQKCTMTREEFRKNVREATESICSIDSDDLDFVVDMLYDPTKPAWTYNDFYELAKEIGKEDGDVIYALGQYDACPDLTNPDNLELIYDWLREHKQAYKDALVYVSQHTQR